MKDSWEVDWDGMCDIEVDCEEIANGIDIYERPNSIDKTTPKNCSNSKIDLMLTGVGSITVGAILSNIYGPLTAPLVLIGSACILLDIFEII